MGDLYRLISQSWRYVGPLLGLGTLAYALDIGLGQLSLFLATVAPFILNTRRLWLLLAALFFYFSYVNIRHRHTPLTVTSLDVTFRIETPRGDRVALSRVQTIRANRHNVTGYHRTLRVDPPGRQDLTECHIDHCNRDAQSVHALTPMGALADPARLEFIHRFAPIPRKLYCLGLNTVKRTETVIQHDSYTREHEYFQLEIPQHYAHKKVKLSIYFHADNACRSDDCKAFRINSNGVVEMELTPIHPYGIQLPIWNPSPGERFIVTWRQATVAREQPQESTG